MKEFIEKLIGRLEESQERYDDVSFAQLNEFGHTLDYEYAKGKRDGVEESIEIVNQLAEEYKVSEMPTGWISVSDRLPSKANHNVLVTYKDRYIGGVYGVCEGQYVHSLKEWQITDYAIDDDFNVIAWCEKPAPYTEGE